MLNDDEGIEKAAVELNGFEGFWLTDQFLRAIIDAIYDYEDEKYLRSGRGRGQAYTERKLLELLYATDYHKWAKHADPNGVMRRRTSWQNSLRKLDVEHRDDGPIVIVKQRQKYIYPSFADMFRMFKEHARCFGPEQTEAVIRGYARPLFAWTEEGI